MASIERSVGGLPPAEVLAITELSFEQIIYKFGSAGLEQYCAQHSEALPAVRKKWYFHYMSSPYPYEVDFLKIDNRIKNFIREFKGYSQVFGDVDLSELCAIDPEFREFFREKVEPKCDPRIIAYRLPELPSLSDKRVSYLSPNFISKVAKELLDRNGFRRFVKDSRSVLKEYTFLHEEILLGYYNDLKVGFVLEIYQIAVECLGMTKAKFLEELKPVATVGHFNEDLQKLLADENLSEWSVLKDDFFQQMQSYAQFNLSFKFKNDRISYVYQLVSNLAFLNTKFNTNRILDDADLKMRAIYERVMSVENEMKRRAAEEIEAFRVTEKHDEKLAEIAALDRKISDVRREILKLQRKETSAQKNAERREKRVALERRIQHIQAMMGDVDDADEDSSDSFGIDPRIMQKRLESLKKELAGYSKEEAVEELDAKEEAALLHLRTQYKELHEVMEEKNRSFNRLRLGENEIRERHMKEMENLKQLHLDAHQEGLDVTNEALGNFSGFRRISFVSTSNGDGHEERIG